MPNTWIVTRLDASGILQGFRIGTGPIQANTLDRDDGNVPYVTWDDGLQRPAICPLSGGCLVIEAVADIEESCPCESGHPERCPDAAMEAAEVTWEQMAEEPAPMVELWYPEDETPEVQAAWPQPALLPRLDGMIDLGKPENVAAIDAAIAAGGCDQPKKPKWTAPAREFASDREPIVDRWIAGSQPAPAALALKVRRYNQLAILASRIVDPWEIDAEMNRLYDQMLDWQEPAPRPSLQSMWDEAIAQWQAQTSQEAANGNA